MTHPGEHEQTFEEYLFEVQKWRGYKIMYPCHDCKGSGIVFDPDDPRCPIEGNKLRRKISCVKCGGSGGINRDEVYARYLDRCAHLARQTAEQKRKDALLKSARDKVALAGLTPEELEILRDERDSY